jgi:hypothetical protein
MNDKTYYTVGTVPKSNRDIIEQEPKSIPLAHIYTTPNAFGKVTSLRCIWTEST